jgi:MGT family glycosyltransferase
MNRLLFAAIPAPGHVNPVLAAATALHDKGYEIIFHTGELFRHTIEAAGLRFIPLLKEADFDHRDLYAAEPSLKNLPENETKHLLLFSRLVGGRIHFQDKSLRSILATEKIDAILTDGLFMGAFPLMLRNQPRPPVIGCGVFAPMWIDAGASIVNGFSNAPGWRERNIEENKQFTENRSPVFWKCINDSLEKAGVTILGGFRENLISRMPDVYLQFGAEAFELPVEEPHGNIVYVGPVLPKRKAGAKVNEWLNKRDRNRPLILVSQGTIANRDLGQLLRPTVEGLANEDVDVVVTGGGASVTDLTGSSNTHIESYIDYNDVLPQAAVFVTNGGYNGVQQALSYGVPLVVAGTTEDKPRVGHRVEYSGVGINLKTATPTKEQVRDAVKETLSNPSYREQARSIQSSLSQINSVDAIANQINTAISSCKLKQKP